MFKLSMILSTFRTTAVDETISIQDPLAFMSWSFRRCLFRRTSLELKSIMERFKIYISRTAEQTSCADEDCMICSKASQHVTNWTLSEDCFAK